MTGQPFTARYDGWCSTCRSSIEPGDVAVHVDSGVVHARCEAVIDDHDPLAIGSRETVCPACFLVHQGECF